MTIKREQKYIIMVDSSYWRVKIKIDKNKTISRCFNFKKHTKLGAFDMAINWRNFILEKYHLLDRLNHKFSPHMFMRSKNTAYIGVCKGDNRNWVCRYSVDGVEFKRAFSINKYGNFGAFKMALEVREKYCGKPVIKNRKKIPKNPAKGNYE